MQTVKRGSTGADVIAWQKILAAGPKPTTWKSADGVQHTWIGPWPLAADGDFGPKTEEATEAWQAAHSLVADGVVGPKSWGVSGAKTDASAPTSANIAFVQARSFNRLANKKNTLIVIHDMEYPETMQAAESVAAWFAGASAPQASAHYCIDADSVVQCVRDEDVAWHTPGKIGDYLNNFSLGLEHAGYAKQTATDWADEFSTAMLLRSAQLVATLCHTYSIPPVRLSAADLKAGKLTGITGHADCTTATGSGTHWDPGPNFPWDWYIEQVQHFFGAAAPVAPPTPEAQAEDEASWVEVQYQGQTWSVAPDYIYPVTIGDAVSIAHAHGCELPSPGLVDAIWAAADLKLDGTKLRRSDFKVWSQAEMSSKAVIDDQQKKIDAAIGGRSFKLLAGSHKDVVLGPGNVVGLYGWEDASGHPIQPFFSGHAATWGDYSQGVRLVRRVK